MIDTHCHLNFKAFDKNLDFIVRQFEKQGGEALIVVGAKEDSSRKAIEIAKKYTSCFSAVGIHPHHVDSITSLNEVENFLFKTASSKKVVAIGECGIDYHVYKNYPPTSIDQKKKQKELFLIHLKVANVLKLPLIIHCREAQEDLLTIISEYMRNNCITGVFHCFDGSEEYLEKVLSLGFYIGFDGNITYKDSQNLQSLAQLTPFDRILVETDSPYLTPEPFRGRPNQPAYLKHTIEFIAHQLHKTPQEIAKITSENARLLFNFDK